MVVRKRSHQFLKGRYLTKILSADKLSTIGRRGSRIPDKQTLVPKEKEIIITKKDDPNDPNITIFKIVIDNETYTSRLDHRAMSNLFSEVLKSSDIKNKALEVLKSSDNKNGALNISRIKEKKSGSHVRITNSGKHIRPSSKR